MWLAYPLSHNLTGSIILTSFYNSYRSYFIIWHTYITKSVTLFPPFLALSSKILPISRSSTKGIVSFYLICCYLSLMPPFIASIYYTILITLILSISKVIPSYSYYIKKGLMYITIIALFGYQPLFYTKYTKANMYLSCNIYSISNTKYICYPTLLSRLVPYLSCYKVSDSIRC